MILRRDPGKSSNFFLRIYGKTKTRNKFLHTRARTIIRKRARCLPALTRLSRRFAHLAYSHVVVCTETKGKERRPSRQSLANQETLTTTATATTTAIFITITDADMGNEEARVLEREAEAEAEAEEEEESVVVVDKGKE